MLDHEQLQQQIPEYLAGTLAGAEGASLEAHLDSCRSCAGIVRHWRTILPELGTVADLSQEPHPDASRLRAAASGSSDPALLRHVESCIRCALELAVWTRRAAAPASFPDAATGRPAWSRRTGIAAIAASLVLGAGLATVAHSLLQSASPPRAAWTGTAPLLVLEGVLRGDHPAPTAVIAAGQPYLPLAVVPVLEPSAGDDERLWFGLAPAGGEGIAWEAEVAVGDVRRQVRQSGAVMFLIPAEGLGDGEYLLRTRGGGASGRKIGGEIPFLIARDDQRQSPAATKPPQ